MNKLRVLALDTLYGRRIEPRDSCLRTNMAGMELSRCGIEALPVIETVIQSKEVVSPVDPDDLTGFDHLVGAYLVIGVRENTERVFEFLKQQPERILQQAVDCCSTFFFKTNNGFNFGVTPNKMLFEFLHDIESTKNGELSNSAREVLGQLESYQSEENEIAK